MSRTWREISELLLSGVSEEDIPEFTCNTCDDVKSCKHAYDLWNLDGDCLVSK